jgi:hypothetical protein
MLINLLQAATYEGEHDHLSQMESTSGTNNRCRNPTRSIVPFSAPSKVTIHWTKSNSTMRLLRI